MKLKAVISRKVVIAGRDHQHASGVRSPIYSPLRRQSVARDRFHLFAKTIQGWKWGRV
jgi:hypothetical protein